MRSQPPLRYGAASGPIPILQGPVMCSWATCWRKSAPVFSPERPSAFSCFSFSPAGFWFDCISLTASALMSFVSGHPRSRSSGTVAEQGLHWRSPRAHPQGGLRELLWQDREHCEHRTQVSFYSVYSARGVTLTKAMHRVNRVGYGFVVRGEKSLRAAFWASLLPSF